MKELPLQVLDKVYRLAVEHEGQRVSDDAQRARDEAQQVLRALPQVSKDTLADLRWLRIPAARLCTHSVEEAVQRATSPSRAWDLVTLYLSDCTDVSALARCPALHTLHLYECHGVTGPRNLSD
jgi:hypothetical protein